MSETVTRESLLAQATEEFPYRVGDGNISLKRRDNRFKELMREHGIPLEMDPFTKSKARVGSYSRQHPKWDR